MTTAIIQNFEKILASGKDSTLLRFSLGNEYLKAGDPASAANHLKQAVVLKQRGRVRFIFENLPNIILLERIAHFV